MNQVSIDWSKLPDQKQPTNIDWDNLPDKAEQSIKQSGGAGGSFDMSLQEKLEDKLIKHPNLYGAYGAVVGTAEELTKYSWLKYIYPEEREKFNKLTTQQQTRQLLMDDLEAVAGLGFGRIISPAGKIAGSYLKKWLPSTYKFLTTPLGHKATKPIQKAVDEGAKVMDMIGRRRADIDVGMLRSSVFINQFERKLSTKELEAIPFIREGIKDPTILSKIGREDLIPFIQTPSPKVRRVTDIIGRYYDESHQFLKENWGDVNFIEDYVTHIWDIPKGRKSEVVNYFATKNPFLKKRTIPTLEEGIKLGLKPKTTNIADLLRIYDQYKIKTAYNFNFAKELKAAVNESGEPLIMRVDKAPADWVTIDHPALNRAMMTGKTTKQVPTTDTFRIINETVEKIKTIERRVPTGGAVTPSTSRQIQALEGVIQNSLEARGMTGPEASLYLNRIRSAYAGAGVAEGEAIERVSEQVSRRVRDRVFREVKTKFPVDVPILSKVPVKVHPDIAKEVKIIFDKPFSHPAIHAMEVVNAFTKKGMLTLSLFHHHALTEAAFATGIGKKAVTLWNPVKIIKALKNKDFAIFSEQKLAEDAIKNGGVTFGALEDVQRNVVQKALTTLERRTKKIPGLNLATKGARKANDLWDTALWDYYHNTLKLWAYEKNVVTGLRGAKQRLGRALTKDEILSVKKEMGNFVNNSFGGQNWDMSRTLGNPKIRQMLHWGLLAPDWTLSVIKQAAAPVRGAVKGGVAGKALMGRGADFWMKAGLYFNLVAQSVNYYHTKQDYGKGRFTWQNSPGNALNIFIGRNDDGTERYMRMGKQFREVLEWGLNPMDKLGGKLSPTARESIRQISGHNPGAGFPTEWAEKEGVATIPGRLKSIASMPIPFSLRPYVESRPGTFMFTFPTKRGMTNYRAVDLFKKALKKKSIDQVKRIYISALENNLDAQQLFRSARSSVKADITYDNKKVAKEILNELQGLDPKAGQDAFMLYRDRGTITPDIALQIDKLMRKDTGIKQQREALGIQGRGKTQ